jgi:hypothetical protein
MVAVRIEINDRSAVRFRSGTCVLHQLKLGNMISSTFSRNALDDQPFFTALDPDARIKGSRDPLGFEPLWTNLGRKVIGNLTTVTDSVRQFSTLLFGYYFADKAAESANRDERFLAAFLRFEQLAAYARYKEKGARTDIRGIRAVTRHVQEHCKLRLSPKADSQILSDQKTYGIYGIFRVAARNSGLLEATDETRLTRPTRDHVESQLQSAGITSAHQKEIVRCIGNDTSINLDGPITECVGALLKLTLSEAETEFYGSHLVRGLCLRQPMDLQQRLWECLKAVNGLGGGYGWEKPFSLRELTGCITEAHRIGDVDLEDRLDRIRRAEEFLGAASMLHGFLLTQDKQTISRVARQMTDKFGHGLEWLHVVDLKDAFGSSSGRLTRLAECLKDGDFTGTCRGLIEQNDAVMHERGGSAWIVLKADRLDVRFLDEDGELPDLNTIREPWVHTYFLNSLKRIGSWIYYGQRRPDEYGDQ